MSKKAIYVVMKCVGNYKDSHEHPIKAFTDKKKAEEFAKEKQEYYNDLEKRYETIDIDIDEIITKAVNKYIEETDKEFYNALLKEEEDTQEDEINKELFDWDKYYDIMCNLESDRDLLKKYLQKCNCTPKQIKMALTEAEYTNTVVCGNLPYVYVDANPIELEEDE